MPESRWRWTRDQQAALRFLRLLAAHRAGYDLRGVRGWAHLADLDADLGRPFYEVLPRLHGRALLDREDVRAPGQVRPVWVYRISERGVAVADAALPAAHRPIPAPRAHHAGGAVYAPSRQRGALLLLREAHEDAAVPVRFGGRGWVTGREVGLRVEHRNLHARRRPHGMLAVDTTDLRWLARWGLAERRDDPGRAALVYWRATELGRAVRLLDWKPLRALE